VQAGAAARGGFSAGETIGAAHGQTSDFLALTACPCPLCGDVGEGLPTAAFALRSSLLLFSRPRRRSLSLLLQWSAASQLEFVTCSPSGVEVVRTRGSGTGVPFVMAPLVPVYVHCGCRDLNIWVFGHEAVFLPYFEH
jgi:hypothetical protein